MDRQAAAEAPLANPDLEQACGLNVLMILDESDISNVPNHDPRLLPKVNP